MSGGNRVDLTLGRARFVAFLSLLGLLLALSVPFAPRAAANHPADACLDVAPETDTNPTGTTHTVTATLRTNGTDASPCDSSETARTTTGPVTINFEITGPNDPDSANSPESPDRQCTIESGQSSCVMSDYAGTVTGTDVIRGWVADSTVDLSEARDETSTPGAAEPDDTDVVEKIWVASAPARLDCDDQSGDDREINPSNQGAQSTETYTCRVTDAQGNPTRDPDSTNANTTESIEVRGENETAGVNDPDAPGSDGATYQSPDYGCTPGSNGQCTMAVTQLRNQTGTATICFWIDSTPGDSPVNEGQAVCDGNAETTDEGEANDSADQVEKTWQVPPPGPSTFTRLDCSPETDTNPTRSNHTITCNAFNPDQSPVGSASIDVEATGANDPDNGNTPNSPDFTCTTSVDDQNTPNQNEAGTCSFTHGPNGVGTTNSAGVTTYRAWVDYNNNNGNSEADPTEGQNEVAEPGTTGETDGTDVVTKTWVSDPNTLEITPEADTATVGECNPFTITVRDVDNKGVPNAIIDVEQVHEEAQDAQPNDEPTVSFCMPSSGPNRTTVNQSAGDLGPNGESPDNQGTAGGETNIGTDSNGQVTIGVAVAPGQGSIGSGDVQITAFYDKDQNNDGTPDDNDDPDLTDPKDTALKSWAAPAGPGGRSIDCEPETATTSTENTHTVTCTVKDANGNAQSGVSVSFTEEGPGQITSGSQQTTNNEGKASVTVSSTEAGQQTITGTITNSFQNEPDTDECDRAANDPQGAQQGVCSDSVTNTWQSPEPEAPQCDDGVDNDGDGQIDHPDDPGCANKNDDDETDEPTGEKCPGYETVPGNHVVGTNDGEELTGTEGDDVICGLGGDDLIDGLGGDDLLLGGDGADQVVGGDGRDEIQGEGGNDTLRGKAQNDTVIGGAGKDVIYGNGGNDSLLGKGGNDAIRGGSGTDIIAGGGGKDTLLGGGGDDEIRGGGNDDILKGGAGNDRLLGNSGNDTLNGGRGQDRCNGGAGRDRIRNCEAGAGRRRRV